MVEPAVALALFQQRKKSLTGLQPLPGFIKGQGGFVSVAVGQPFRSGGFPELVQIDGALDADDADLAQAARAESILEIPRRKSEQQVCRRPLRPMIRAKRERKGG
jgi:hypothetical protein